MSPLPFSHLTNEIVDLTMDTSAAMRETGDTWTMFMGVVVTLLPKVRTPGCYVSTARERQLDRDHCSSLGTVYFSFLGQQGTTV